MRDYKSLKNTFITQTTIRYVRAHQSASECIRAHQNLKTYCNHCQYQLQLTSWDVKDKSYSQPKCLRCLQDDLKTLEQSDWTDQLNNPFVYGCSDCSVQFDRTTFLKQPDQPVQLDGTVNFELSHWTVQIDVSAHLEQSH